MYPIPHSYNKTHSYNKKYKVKRKKHRKMTMQYHVRCNQFSTNTVPELRLRGNWLEELGFAPGQPLLITTADKQVVIQVNYVQQSADRRRMMEIQKVKKIAA